MAFITSTTDIIIVVTLLPELFLHASNAKNTTDSNVSTRFKPKDTHITLAARSHGSSQAALEALSYVTSQNSRVVVSGET